MFGEQIDPVVVLAYFLGVGARVFWPYLRVWLHDKEPFNPRLIVSQLISAFGIAIALFASSAFVATIGTMPFIAAAVLGYGAGELGREAQRSLVQFRNRGQDAPEPVEVEEEEDPDGFFVAVANMNEAIDDFGKDLNGR